MTDFTGKDVPDQTGKTFFITGANTGIGFEAAKVFAGAGARVLLGCRNTEKGKAALARIADAHPGADTQLVEIDLSDLASVRKAAEVVARESHLDVLVNNAGVMWNPKTITKDGFESQFGINHLGHFALTGLLLPVLEATPNSRIVTVSSTGHRLGNGDLFWDDINAEKEYHPRKRYYASKLANLLFTYELDRRLSAKGASTIAVAVHPGGSDTELGRYVTGGFGMMMRVMTPLMRPFMNSAETGAWPTELAATAPAVEGGQYFGPSRYREMSGSAKQVDSSPESKDPQKAKRLWDLSIEMTGIDPGI
ncbi:MAG: SDR family NAD(P)-dependent oxidoreductase [bacterium]|nr:SDR family NAD(P)-dependent oxidoreductase [bacterium]